MPDGSVKRSEDARFLAGAGRYVENVLVGGALRAVFVRSMMPHALIRSVDASAARAMQGVVGVFMAADVDIPPQPVSGLVPDAMNRPVLASDVARFAGEQIAVVVAETEAQAADAAEAVVVDFEPLQAVTDPEEALRPAAPILFPEHGSNLAHSFEEHMDDDVLAAAEVVVSGRFINQRLVPVPLETNACTAVPGEDDATTLWVSTQIPFDVRGDVSDALGVAPAKVRVIAPDVGGAFGAKLSVYPEYLVVAALARRLGRPVRWSESRSESMLALTHGRGQVQYVELGAKRDGTLVGLRADVVADMGAYPVGAFLPSLTHEMSSGQYAIPRIAFRARCAVTNTTPIAPYRGAGRPEAAALIERAMDMLAAELRMDPAEIRRRNFIREFPHETATGQKYDSGNYGRALEEVLRMVEYDALRVEQAARRGRGDVKQLGIGLGTYVEMTSIGGGTEFASVEMHEDGHATVKSGLSPSGQGHETSLAQVASRALGIPFEHVRVVHSDTGVVSRGEGTWGSRSLQIGGSAVLAACEKLKAEGGTYAEVDFTQTDSTFPFGAHVAVVEVDTETGGAELVKMVAVDDAGVALNPMMMQGQIHGGVAQGIAQALFEEMTYDEDGNPMNANLATYAIPSAADLPSFETVITQTPTDRNPLGAKGIGESGTIGATPAVQNAVVDAVSYLGVTHIDMPLVPERVWRAIQDARATR